MSTETSYAESKQLDTAEPQLLTHASEICSAQAEDKLLTEPGTLTEFGGSSLFGEALTDQSDNPLLT